MNILALETSSNVCSVAVGTADVLAAVSEVHLPNMHDVALVTLVEQALSNANLSLADIDAVAVSAGPGSFTGLRIGASFAKGLCHGSQPKLIAVSTMLAIAVAANEVAMRSNCNHILAVIPSHRGLYFTQLFSTSTDVPLPNTDLRLLPHAEVVEHNNSVTLVAGSGATDIDPHSISGLSRLSARFVLRAVQLQHKNGAVVWTAPEAFEPMYGQEFGQPYSSSSDSSSSSSSMSS